jgi:hypothetical protein
MMLRAISIFLALLAPLAPARADYLVLDGNRNPLTFKSAPVPGGQLQQTLPSDATATPFSQSNPQYFNLLIGGFLPSIGQNVKANSIPVTAPSDPDLRPAPGTITAVDTGSTTASGQNGASVVTGAASVNSFLSQTVNGVSTARLQLSGTWSGTLAFEQSIDNTATWGAMACHVNGTIFSGSSAIGNGLFDCEVAGATNYRVRATAWTSGTAVVTATVTAFPGVVKILNSVALKDNASGAALSIKPGSTAAAPTDTAAVVVIRDPSTTTPLGVTSTDGGGAITSGGSYQVIIAASGSRKGCFIQNPATATELLNVKFGTMVNPITLSAGQSAGCNVGGIVLQDSVTAMATTTGHAFVALAQ